MATELREAKVTVRINTDEALKELDRLDAETKARREQLDDDEKRRREEATNRPEKADDARSTENAAAGPRATNADKRDGAGRQTAGGVPLSSWGDVRSRARDFAAGPAGAVKALGQETARAIPIVGPFFVAGGKFVEYGAEYGPASLAALRPFVPEAVRDEFDRAADAVRSSARFVEKLGAKVRSVDTTYEQLRAMAVTQSLWGVPVRPERLAAEGARLYRVNYAQDMQRRTRDAIGREAGGTAVGNIVGEVIRDVFGGGAR